MLHEKSNQVLQRLGNHDGVAQARTIKLMDASSADAVLNARQISTIKRFMPCFQFSVRLSISVLSSIKGL